LTQLEFGQGPLFASALAEAQKYQTKYTTSDAIPDSEVPVFFDWRNVGGYDFTGKIRDQKQCGSCYTMAFTQTMEARLKLKYGKEAEQLSPQMLLDCNYMTEGCEGGWPHLHAYFAENGYLVGESCAPYQAQTLGTTCSQYKDCKPVARVRRSYDVGGAYGQTSERHMMKEILRNGALNTEF